MNGYNRHEKSPAIAGLFCALYPCSCELCTTKIQKLVHIYQKKSSYSFEKQDIFQNPLSRLKKFAKV